jgi:hypothetical protein
MWRTLPGPSSGPDDNGREPVPVYSPKDFFGSTPGDFGGRSAVGAFSQGRPSLPTFRPPTPPGGVIASIIQALKGEVKPNLVSGAWPTEVGMRPFQFVRMVTRIFSQDQRPGKYRMIRDMEPAITRLVEKLPD